MDDGTLQMLITGATFLFYALKLHKYFEDEVVCALKRYEEINKDHNIDETTKKRLQCLVNMWSGNWRILWVWVPGILLFLAFLFVTVDLIVTETVFSKLYVASFIIAILIVLIGIIFGMSQRPTNAYIEWKKKKVFNKKD